MDNAKQVVSIIGPQPSNPTLWTVALTIPFGSESISTRINEFDNEDAAHEEGLRLFRALVQHNRTRPTFIASHSMVSQLEGIVPQDRIVQIPQGAKDLVRTLRSVGA